MASNYALNNVTAPSPAPTLASTLVVGVFVDHFNIDVTNAAVYWQLQGVALPTGTPQNADWTPFVAVQMIPGSRTISRVGVTGIRFWAVNAAANPQAIVTVEAVVA